MRGINMKMALLPILLISMLATMIAVKPISAQGTTLYLTPVVSTGNIGDTVDVDVMIKDVVDLYGYEFRVEADPNVVMVTGIDVGDFLPTPPGYKVWKLDIADGSYAWLAVTRPLGSASGVSGSGRLATIHFEVIGEGYTYLWVTVSVLGDPFGYSIDHATAAGVVSSITPTVFDMDLRKRRSTSRPGDYSLKYPSAGTTQTLYGEVENLGTIPVYVQVRFEVFKEAGLPGGTFYSELILVEPGQSIVMTAVMPIDASMVGTRFYVTNYAEYTYLGMTGISTCSYSFVVVEG